jgi:O-antigen/teichoic acid export membrane protein
MAEGSFRRSLAWVTLSQVAFFALQFGGSVVLAHLLTPYEMGIYAVAGALMGVLWMLQAFGLSGFVVREPELTRDIVAAVFSVNGAINSVIGAGMALIGLFGQQVAHEAGVRQILLVMSVLPVISTFEFMPAAVLERNAQFRDLAFIGTARNLVSTVVTVALAFAGYRYLSIAYAQIAGTIVSMTLANVLARRHVTFGLGVKDWRRVLSFGTRAMAISTVNSIAGKISDLSLGRFQGYAALGLYNRAGSLNGLLWDNIHLVVGRVLFVDFAQVKREGRSLRDRYLLTVEMMTGLLWPAFCGFATLAGPFILTVYGAKWTPAAQPLILLAAASIVQVSITMTWEIFVISDRLKEQTRIEFIRTAVGTALFVGACFVSITAAAAARLLDAIFSMLLYRPQLERMTDTRLADTGPIYARSALLTLLATAPALVLMAAHRGSPATPLPYVAGAIAVGVALWVAGLLALRHPLIEEARRLLDRRGRAGRDAAAEAVTPEEVAVSASAVFEQPSKAP